MQKYLNELAARGWELISTDHFSDREFVPTNRTELTYYVDLVPPGEPEEERRSYLRLCEDAGWELVGTTNQMRIFVAALPPSGAGADGRRAGGGQLPPVHRPAAGVQLLGLLLVLGMNLLPALAINGSERMLNELRDAVVHGWYVSWFVDACLVILPLLLIGQLFRAAEQSAMAVWCWRSVEKHGVLPAPRAVMYLHSGWMLLSLLSLMTIWCACAADGLSGGRMYVIYIALVGLIAAILIGGLINLVGSHLHTGTEKGDVRMTALLAVCLAALALLDWKGPWQHYGSAVTSSSVDAEAEAVACGAGR